MVNQEKIIFYIQFSKNEISLNERLYKDIVIFKPLQNMFAAIIWIFAKEE